MTLDQFIRLYSHLSVSARQPTLDTISPLLRYVDVTSRFDSEMKWELYHLDDYVVSSQSCGTVTLCPR